MNLEARVSRAESLTSKVSPSPLLGSAIFVALAVLFPILICAQESLSGSVHPAWIGALVSCVVAASKFAWVVAGAQRRLFEMVTWLFIYTFLGLTPLVQLRGLGTPSTTPWLEDDYYWSAVGVVLLFEVALICGTVLGRLMVRHEHVEPSRVLDAPRLYMVSASLLSLGLLYIAAVGVDVLFGPRIARGSTVWALFANPVLAQIVEASVSIGLLTALVGQFSLLRSFPARRKLLQYTLLGVTLLALAVIVNPVSSPRYLFGVILLGVLAAFGGYATITRYRLVSVAAFAGLVLVFPVLDSFRYTTSEGFDESGVVESLVSADYDAFSQLVNIVQYVDEVGYSFGGQLLGVLLFWIPRELWSGKPVDTGILIADFKGYTFTNLSAPLPGELFINGGILAVIGGAVVLGLCFVKWDSSSEASLIRIGQPTVLGAVLPFYMLLVLRGSLLQAMASLTVVFVIWFLCSKRSL